MVDPHGALPGRACFLRFEQFVNADRVIQVLGQYLDGLTFNLTWVRRWKPSFRGTSDSGAAVRSPGIPASGHTGTASAARDTAPSRPALAATNKVVRKREISVMA